MPSGSKLAGVSKTVDRTKSVLQGIDVLVSTQVMVGVPEEKDERRQTGIGNATLAYIHDKGSPEAGIPARPFMAPGIRAVQQQIIAELYKAGQNVLKWGPKNVTTYLNRVGIIATRSIKATITEGIPPPLAESTIRGRISRVKSKTRRKRLWSALAQGTPASRQNGVEGLFTPLIVTAQLRNAITYVLRKAKR